MPTLYVATQGARIRKTSRRLLVSTDDAVLHSVRLRDVDRVVMAGSVELTSPALRALLEGRIETTFLSRGGRLLGSLSPPGGKNVFLRVAQVQRYTNLEFRLRVGKSVVAAKILNGRRVLQLFGRRRKELDLSATKAALESSAHKAAHAESVAQLMGIEGEAAATYFRAFGNLFLGDLRFETRSRRPPRDPVNSLLSFGYTLLTGETIGAAFSEGLDPDVGFLHELSYGRPSLALDLVEEFRQPVVDRFVLSVINRRVIRPADFTTEGEGVLLQDRPRGRFFEFYDRVMTSEFRDRSGQTVTYRSLLRAQARQMARAVMNNEDYLPYRIP
ncbi:MAG: CRISPR-associated endonuclease Cas1 [Armatimonadetes bacterium]|nr:CRISPR-associated endonuclease Cas1 [Armatimonadota bacterium]